MAVPKNRHTKSRRNTKRSHIKLSGSHFAVCEKCKKSVLPHTMCENCGTYKGREVINVLAKLDKKERKAREKEMKETEAQEAQAAPDQPMSMEELSK